MKTLLFILIIVSVAYCLDAPNIWPLPQKYSYANKQIVLDSAFEFDVPDGSDILAQALLRYKSLIFNYAAAPAGGVVLSKLTVRVVNISESLTFGLSEAYKLDVPADGSDAVITADTVWGALHAIETFSQLVSFDSNTERYVINQAPWSIADYPRFPHRGYLIDTSRHWMPLPALYKIIDSLSYAKMNVLHWHIVDAQSYPLQSKVRPKLWSGSWTPYERYTLSIVKQVVEYARYRGIRVMLEIDGPGHAWSWGTGYPEVLPANYSLSAKCPADCPHNIWKCNVPLDPSKEATYNLISDVFNELLADDVGKGIFVDNFVHLGGDEVETDCWAMSTEIKKWMDANKFTYEQAYKYFINRVQGIVRSHNRTPVHWEEVFLHFGKQLPPETIIHVWLDHKTITSVVAAGYRVLLSDWRHWYIDHLESTWQVFYSNEPCDSVSDADCARLVLGGETCAWSETQDTNNLFLRMWPRAAAVAERLWSSRSAVTGMDVETVVRKRLNQFRCGVLDPRGVNAQPLSNLWQVTAPASCWDNM